MALDHFCHDHVESTNSATNFSEIFIETHLLLWVWLDLMQKCGLYYTGGLVAWL